MSHYFKFKTILKLSRANKKASFVPKCCNFCILYAITTKPETDTANMLWNITKNLISVLRYIECHMRQIWKISLEHTHFSYSFISYFSAGECPNESIFSCWKYKKSIKSFYQTIPTLLKSWGYESLSLRKNNTLREAKMPSGLKGLILSCLLNCCTVENLQSCCFSLFLIEYLIMSVCAQLYNYDLYDQVYGQGFWNVSLAISFCDFSISPFS